MPLLRRYPVAVAVLVAVLCGIATLRLPEALAAGLTVLLAAGVAGTVSGPRATLWTSALVAALVSNPVVEVVAAPRDRLELPLVLGAVLLTLLAVRRVAWPLAIAAGLVGGLATDWSGLAFGAVLLVGCWRTARLPGRAAVRLGVAGLVGAVLSTVVPLLWDGQVHGLGEAAPAPERITWTLLTVATVAGLLAVLGGLLGDLRAQWHEDPPLVASALAVVLVDLAVVVLGGDWRTHLLPLVPAVTLCAALVVGRGGRPGRTMRVVVLAVVATAAVALVCWLVWSMQPIAD